MMPNEPSGLEPRTNINRSNGLYSGRIRGLVHGQLAPTGAHTRGSLIVFDFWFHPTSRQRIISARVSITFAPRKNDTASHSPVIISLAPQGSMRLFPHEQTESHILDLSASAGVSASIGAGWKRETTRTRQSAMLLRGEAVFQGNDTREPNGVQWFLEENSALKEGLTCALRCVVLLARQDDEHFDAKVKVETKVSGTIFQATRFLSGSKIDDPIIFNPNVTPPNQHLDGVDPQNLGAVDLKSIAYLHSQELLHHADIRSLGGVGHGEDSFQDSLEDGLDHLPSVIKNTWKEGETRDQILLSFAKGEYDSSFQFNSFHTIGVFNLYLYQHRLVKLEKNLKKKIAEGGEIDDAEADNLAKLMREYHEALRTFKELSDFEGLPNKIARAANVELRAKLNDDNYASEDDLSMIDLFGEPTSDAVRRWVQKRLSRLWRRSSPAEQIMTRVEAHTPGLAGVALPVGVEIGGQISIEKKETRLLAGSVQSQATLVGISPAADKLAGFLVALVGGAFLLAPMCELVYVETQKWRLISVVLWVLFFAFAVAATSKAKNVELLGATAAYAAVLVVFVGQSQ